MLTGLHRYVALHFADDIFIEPYYKPAPLRLFASAGTKIVNIVPAIVVKNIGYDRRTEQKTHLVAGHTDLDALYILRLQFVALLYVKLVNTTRGEADYACQYNTDAGLVQ